jgi:peptidoglycan/LPS O-acetylase OafA/YrhL
MGLLVPVALLALKRIVGSNVSQSIMYASTLLTQSLRRLTIKTDRSVKRVMHNSQTPATHPTYRPDIDGLRAVAIISVVLFHTFPEQLPGGFIGVDVFFVISGFLISTIIFSNLENTSFSLMDFYLRRIRRIFPALIVVLSASLLIGWLVLFPDEFQQLGKHTAASAGFVQNFVLWRESGYFDADANTKPLLHLWTLAVEEQFYIVWPLLLLFVWKRGWNFLAITGIAAVASFGLNIYLLERDPVAAFYLPVSRFWELMLGGVLAYLMLHHPGLFRGHGALRAFLGFALILTAMLVLDEGDSFPGWWALLPTVGAFLIISAEPGNGLSQKMLGNKLMVQVGLISYPLYLWHWPLLSYLHITRGDPSQFLKLGAVSTAVVLAWLTYKLVELPVRRRGNPGMQAAPLFAAIASLGIVGAVAYTTNGHQSEEAEQVTNAGVKTYDHKAAYRFGECFIQGWPNETFSRRCGGTDPGKPTVFLWGDSHAASLYPGLLKQSKSTGFNLAQYNIADCPPVFDFDTNAKPTCKALTEQVRAKLQATKPDTVILAGYWLKFDGKHEYKGQPWHRISEEALSATLSYLKSLGVRNIIVVGQLPTFVRSQQSIGEDAFVENVSDRTYEGYDLESGVADDRIREIALANKVGFVSPINILCNEDGCLISTSSQAFTPLAWDKTHLTTHGSEYLVASAVASNQLRLPAK